MCSALILLFAMPSCEPGIQKAPYLLGQGFGLSNVSLNVDDLEKARTYFRDTLGFSLRGDFRNGSYDGALVTRATFADNSGLELFAIVDSTADGNRPELGGAGNGIMREFAFSSSSVDSTRESLTGIGYSFGETVVYRESEKEPEGWSYETAGPQKQVMRFEQASNHLPGFVEDLRTDYKAIQSDWITWYSFWREFRNNDNGVLGISNLMVAVKDLEAAKKDFKQLGLTELESTEREVRFQVSDYHQLELVASEVDSGLQALRFEVLNIDSTYAFLSEKLPEEALLKSSDSITMLTIPKAYAYGLELEFVQEPAARLEKAQQLQAFGVLDSAASANAADMYAKYCALCHGEDREGYAADNAPSLKSKSLLASAQGTNFMRYTIQYGRANTAMAGYLQDRGGPMKYIEIEQLLTWLYQEAGVEESLKLSREPVEGDVELGAQLYEDNCAVCHGAKGEGVSAPALGNSMLLATATDEFLKYAIKEGRDGTPMIAYKDQFEESEINALTAFLRSRASGWDIPKMDTVSIPTPDQYVLNPDNPAPDFTLKEGKFLPAAQLLQALQDSARIIILDARSEVAWRQMHIPGAVPVPYYEEPESFVEDIPNDDTWVVAYCACPHAASGRVVNTLRRYGYKNTAILDEGILVWGQLGYPVRNGN